MTCGQLPLGGCGNPDLGHLGPCTPYTYIGMEIFEDDETGDIWIRLSQDWRK